MENVTLIAAIGKDRELGKDNSLIWYIPGDLKFFRDNTTGKHIVMGMNTFKSLPKLLPNRKHIVLTRSNVDLGEEVMVLHNIDELLDYISLIDSEVMIIGGAQIYSLMLEHADKMLLTEIDNNFSADVFFPEFSKNDWDREVLSEQKYEDLEYKHVVYTRKRFKK